MAPKKKEVPAEIAIESVSVAELSVWLIGTSPLLMNRLAEKARHELLLPAPAKNRAAKQSTLKHVPIDEYRASIYRQLDDDAPTRLVFPGGGLRKAIASAALDMPGSSKAQIGRLVRVAEYNLAVYGVPRICCMVVRQADIKKTPDVRTRAIIPEWCCQVTIRFAHPILKQAAILSLLTAAGDFIGIGDGRNEKGSSLSCGCFRIAANAQDMKEVERIRKAGGLKQQDAAIEDPEAFDADTRTLLEWFDEEIKRRGVSNVASFNGRCEEDEEEEAEAATAE